jgi:hypothetical protein
MRVYQHIEMMRVLFEWLILQFIRATCFFGLGDDHFDLEMAFWKCVKRLVLISNNNR